MLGCPRPPVTPTRSAAAASCGAGGILITGGLGALGALVAQWLAQPHGNGHNACSGVGVKQSTAPDGISVSSPATAARYPSPPDLYLVSRTGRPDATSLAPDTPLARLLTASPALVTIIRADVATAEDAAAALAASPAAMGRKPVTSVVHASGVIKVKAG